MKKIFIVLLGLTPFICLHQANAQTTPKASTTAVKAMTISCSVSADEKRILGCTHGAEDRRTQGQGDRESWAVANPKILKGHAGDYVSITAEVDTSKNMVTVKTVKVLVAGAANTPNKAKDNDDTPLMNKAQK